MSTASQGQLDGDAAWARAEDERDPLRGLRARFALPRADAVPPLIYLCGHSLGPAPIAAREFIDRDIDDWERLAVLGHEQARSPWIGYAEQLQRPLAQLCGAEAAEVVAMNSLSVNLHLLLASFYRPAGERRVVLIEAGAFSSDRHVVAAQIAWHGIDPAAALFELAPRQGEECLRLEDIEARIAALGARLALVLWPGVQYRTGQSFDLGRIARAAHAVGAQAGFDLAHAIGNVPLSLHDDDADFAVWCSYKYLNAGPGAVGGAFVHARHAKDPSLPRLAGWWGHEAVTRFAMRPEFRAAAGAAGWAVSNPPIFSSAALRASLPLFAEAGMPALRAKSIALTGCLERYVRQHAAGRLAVITPPEPAQRGCQLSLRLPVSDGRGRAMFEALSRDGVIGDWREPDVIRLAPAPLYNSFGEVLEAAARLCAIARA
ncbi:MAG TPA: kynureninase [Steroidobacteraceae bacterium]